MKSGNGSLHCIRKATDATHGIRLHFWEINVTTSPGKLLHGNGCRSFHIERLHQTEFSGCVKAATSQENCFKYKPQPLANF